VHTIRRHKRFAFGSLQIVKYVVVGEEPANAGQERYLTSMDAHRRAKAPADQEK
jgi:hypothetical protein